MPSIVLTSRPSASRPSIKQERMDRSSTSTVQVPHSPSSQPCFVPVRFKSSRSTSSSVLCGVNDTSCASPFTVKRTRALESAVGFLRAKEERLGLLGEECLGLRVPEIQTVVIDQRRLV